MAAILAGVKFDDGTGGFINNCFPARNHFRQSEDAGAWLVAHKAEERRHFKAVLCAKPKTYAQIKHERREKERELERKRRLDVSPAKDVTSHHPETGNVTTEGLLDGFYLLKHSYADDPTDICSINITGKSLTDVKEEDFQLFDNVAYINAGENLLPFDAFSNFPIVRELELPLNAIRGIKVDVDDFPCLEVLDLSYNNLSNDDILSVGTLPKLKVLYLTGNQLRSLPTELAKPYKVNLQDGKDTSSVPRFANLELLFLDDNHLTDLATFASLAGLRRLQRLNLDRNDICSVPHLRALSGKHGAVVESVAGSAASTPGRRTPSSGRARSGGGREGGGRRSPASPAEPTRAESDPPPSNINEELDASLLGIAAASASSTAAVAAAAVSSSSQELPAPFPELEHLSLAFNKITEEESVLAVAAWPMVRELVIHDNPLTVTSSGDPPLLRRFLVDRLGVRLIRKRPESRPAARRQAVKIPSKPHRKVAEVVRPIPKQPLQLRLESAGPSPKALPSPPPTASPRPSHGTIHRSLSAPLPPITGSPDRSPRTAPLRRRVYDDKPVVGSSTSVRDIRRDAGKAELVDEPVFLTQVDDQMAETSRVPSNDETKQLTTPRDKGRVDSAAYSINLPDKFKGYEIFFDTPEDDPEDELIIAKDIQSNLRSLRLALKRPNLHQNQVDLERLQKPFQPYSRTALPPRVPHKDRAEKLDGILETMKNRLVTEELNLGELLQDKQALRKHPEAVVLLEEIQAKYSAVRATSMQSGDRSHGAIADTLNATEGLGVTGAEGAPHGSGRVGPGRTATT